MDLGEVRRELRLLELAGRHILMRLDNFAPRLETCDRLDRNLEPLGFPPFLIALKFGELGAQDRIAHPAQLLGGVAGADRFHEAAHGIEGQRVLFETLAKTRSNLVRMWAGD